jgi:hypothetical protein
MQLATDHCCIKPEQERPVLITLLTTRLAMHMPPADTHLAVAYV